ncbi:hypothetical protein A2716_01905 [candidate division WWE3 bacterium RIFCSPHIGHO2_01_FULL_40_23]|nr:MAG: hypothetical protein A2716_01905 [candidate division WWE3 bacterium RIFCSPHIGHO2_01_FULL_40_23]
MRLKMIVTVASVVVAGLFASYPMDTNFREYTTPLTVSAPLEEVDLSEIFLTQGLKRAKKEEIPEGYTGKILILGKGLSPGREGPVSVRLAVLFLKNGEVYMYEEELDKTLAEAANFDKSFLVESAGIDQELGEIVVYAREKWDSFVLALTLILAAFISAVFLAFTLRI